MIGYNRDRLNNYFHLIQINQWKKQGWLSDEQYSAFEQKINPRYEETNLFIRSGLFLLTAVIISAALGFCALLFGELINNSNSWFFSLLGALINFIILQKIVINRRNQFRSGMDDAALYGGMLFTFIACFLVFENSIFNDPFLSSIFFFVFFFSGAFFYVDRLLTILATASFLATFFLLLDKVNLLWLASFAMMLISCGLYFLSKRLGQMAKHAAAEACWDIVLWLAMIVFYVAGNCFIVFEMSIEMLNMESVSAIPFQWFFYAFTVLTPILYIYIGLKKRNLAFLNIGLAAIATGVMSIRYYHNFMAFEFAMIIGGLALIGVAWSALRYWRNDKHGITIKPDELENRLNVEALIIDQTMGTQKAESGFEGSGGKFGGGGASGGF